MATLAKKSLYERVGGHPGIGSIVNDLYERLSRHHKTWYHWKGCDPADQASEQALFVDMVSIYAGGPIVQHEGAVNPVQQALILGEVEWGDFVALVAESLVQSNVDSSEKEELFSILTRAMTGLVVGKQSQSDTARFAGYAPGLSDREREVLRLLALGKNNSEIAQELYISINTVTRHVTNIFFKTGTRNRVEAAVYAVRHRFL